MSELPATRSMCDEYELLGSALDPRDISLDMAVATELHDYAAQDFFPKVMRARPKRRIVLDYSDSRDVCAAGVSFGPNPYSAPDLQQAGFTGVRLSHDSLNGWRLRALVTSYQHDGTPNKLAVRYAVDIDESMVLQARREVRLTRPSGNYVRKAKTRRDAFFARQLETIEPNEPLTERKALQTGMTTEDCQRLQARLQRAARRMITLG